MEIRESLNAIELDSEMKSWCEGVASCPNDAEVRTGATKSLSDVME